MDRFQKIYTPLVAAAVAAALVLGFANLGAPSIWHDEAVHIFDAKSILRSGFPTLPGGRVHPVAPIYNYVLALFIGIFGDGEVAVRAPSVIFAAINVALTFWVLRPLIGPAGATIAAFALALSPWAVAWSRQARFYSAQQTFYLLVIGLAWRALTANHSRSRLAFTAAAAFAYIAGLGISLHSVLALTPLCAYAGILFLRGGRDRRRCIIIAAATAAAGLITMLLYRLLLPQPDADAIFKSGGWFDLAGWWYYLDWLWCNLGLGFVILAAAGFALMIIVRGRPGLYAALAFLIPIACLSLLLGYRIHRFMFFLYPFYVAGFSYGVVEFFRYARTWRLSWSQAAISTLLVLFFARLAISEYGLLRASILAARGADTTLATRHPQWRIPCQYVRDHIDADTAVLTTTYMSALYYVGRVDNWYPNRYLPWEECESGLKGIKNIDELKAFIADHPKGYFLAEWFRFANSPLTAEDLKWVEQNMTNIKQASTGDVYLYSWGF